MQVGCIYFIKKNYALKYILDLTNIKFFEIYIC